jgi:hypothetical protein
MTQTVSGALFLAWEDASPWSGGYSIVGPFPNEEAATNAAFGQDWAVVPIYAPKGAEVGNTAHADGDRLIVVIGDVVNGFQAFGPFIGMKAAGAWVAKHGGNGGIVVEMEHIENYDEEFETELATA